MILITNIIINIIYKIKNIGYQYTLDFGRIVHLKSNKKTKFAHFVFENILLGIKVLKYSFLKLWH